MDRYLYPNLPKLIIDVVEHVSQNGDFIEIENSPKQLLFQWKCAKTGKEFWIQLSKVRRLGMWDDHCPISKDLRRIISENRGNGSEVWQRAVIQDSQIKRMCKLRAFW